MCTQRRFAIFTDFLGLLIHEGESQSHRGDDGANNSVFYLLRDHLNSSSAIVNQSGDTLTNGNQYYYPYGANCGGAFSNLTTNGFTARPELVERASITKVACPAARG